jgi:hypothetical protein
LRILIDECLPSELADELVGHEARTVQQVGWAGLKNGALMRNISGRFEVFLTIDKRIESEQELPKDVVLITVRAQSNRIQDLRPLVPQILEAVAETPPGKSVRVAQKTGRGARRH